MTITVFELAQRLRKNVALLAAALGLSALGVSAPVLWAADYDVSPKGGDFTSVAQALQSGRLTGGDRLLLAPGNHGALTVQAGDFDPALIIGSADPQNPAHVDLLRVETGSGIVLQDLQVWPLTRQRGQPTLVLGLREATNIRFERLDIRGGPQAQAYYDWTLEDWTKIWRLKGVYLGGADTVLADSTITAVSTGIGVGGARAQVINNEVRGFSRDGLRGFGEGVVFRGNTVRDCIRVDGNHDDGFQSWTARGGAPDEIVNITLDGNRILEWTGAPDHPLRCHLQGISMFNGPYRDMVVQNNLVVIRAAHGITLKDGINSRIVNNTVIQIDGVKRDRPWIMEKREKVSSDAPANLIANNLVTSLKLAWRRGPAARNSVVPYPYRVFVDPETFDFRLKHDSGLRGSGDPSVAPDHDIDGTPRPSGAGIDPGAFQTP